MKALARRRAFGLYSRFKPRTVRLGPDYVMEKTVR
jgi:hypothetical protein